MKWDLIYADLLAEEQEQKKKNSDCLHLSSQN